MSVAATDKRKMLALRDLPTFPIIAQKILREVDDDEAGAHRLSSLIANDQSLSIKVLSLANSAYYGHRAQVATVKQAVVVIGTAMLRQLSLGVLISKNLGQGSPEREIFWRHSLLSANAAATIAKHARLPDSEICFMGGLLHDIGKLVLDTNMPVEYKKVLAMVWKEEWPLLEAEREVFGTDHTQVGTWMAERWQLPRELIQVIGLHHKEDVSYLSCGKSVAAVHAASICSELVDVMEILHPDETPFLVPPGIQSALGLSQQQFMDITVDLFNRRTELQRIFG